MWLPIYSFLRRRRSAATRNPTPHGRTCGAPPTRRGRPNERALVVGRDGVRTHVVRFHWILGNVNRVRRKDVGQLRSADLIVPACQLLAHGEANRLIVLALEGLVEVEALLIKVKDREAMDCQARTQGPNISC